MVSSSTVGSLVRISAITAGDNLGLRACSTSQRFLNLPGSSVLIPAIDICHQEDLLFVTIAECPARPDLTDAAVLIPADIRECDPAIDCIAKQRDALIGVPLLSEVITASAERGNMFTNET